MNQLTNAGAKTENELQRERQAGLDEARKLFAVDIPNSGHAVASALEARHVEGMRDGVKLLQERVERAVALLVRHVPEISATAAADTTTKTQS